MTRQSYVYFKKTFCRLLLKVISYNQPCYIGTNINYLRAIIISIHVISFAVPGVRV